MLYQAHVPVLNQGSPVPTLLTAYAPIALQVPVQALATSATPVFLEQLLVAAVYPAMHATQALALMQPDIMVSTVLLRALYQHLHLSARMVFAPPAILYTRVLLG